MAVIDEIKIILDVTDKDALLILYIRKANTLISNYLRTTVEASTVYPDAVIEYVAISFNKKGNEGLSQFKFENTEASYIGDGLPKSVKDLLPLPCIKMLGAYLI